MARSPSPSTSADPFAPNLNISKSLEFHLLRAYGEFIEDPQRFIDQYKIYREEFIDSYADANRNDPFMVSDRCADGWEDNDWPVVPQVKFYTARLVENYTANKLRGKVLRKATNNHFQKKFPVRPGLYQTEKESDDNQQEYGSQRDDNSDEGNTQQEEGENYNQDEPRWLEDISQCYVRLLAPMQFLVSVISDGLRQGLTVLGFTFNVLWNFLCWVWTSPALHVPRWVFGNIFWGGLITLSILFVSAIVWNVAVEKIQYAFSNTPSLESGHQVYTPPTNPFPDPTPLSGSVYNLPRNTPTNPLFDTINNFTQVANLTLDLLVVQKVLRLTEEDLISSKSIVAVSDLPYRHYLQSSYDVLRGHVIDLREALDNFDLNVKQLTWTVKFDLRDTLVEIDMLSVDPNLRPLPLDFIVESLQFTLDKVAAACEWYLIWNGRYSIIFCGGVFTLGSFLNDEIRCKEFVDQPMLDRKRCFFLLADYPNTTVLRQRKTAFNLAVDMLTDLLNNIDARLIDLSESVKKPAVILLRIDERRHDMINTMDKSKKLVLDQDTNFRLRRDQEVERWNSRRFAQKLQDWWAGRELPAVDMLEMVRIQGSLEILGRARDFSNLEITQERVGGDLGKISEAIETSRGAITLSCTRVEQIKKYFERTFCVGTSYPSPHRNCGTDRSFVDAFSTILVNFYELNPLLERIEDVGVMSQEVERGVEKKEQELERKCEAVAVLEEERLKSSGIEMGLFVIGEKRREAMMKCKLHGWLNDIT